MYYVYIAECSDKTLYTGITTNLERRLNQHNAGLGAKYTKGRQPLTLKFSKKFSTRSKALKEELRIKKLSRAQKLNLIS